MQLPLDLKWNQTRNRRSLLGRYSALALIAVLCIWNIPRLSSILVPCFAFMLDPENRRFVLAGTARAMLATVVVTATGLGASALWRFMTTHIWQIPRRYTRAIAQLEDDRIEQRLQSLQMLKRIAKLALSQQGATTKTLADFVQQRASIYTRNSPIALPEAQTIAADIQAALTLIGQKPLLCRVLRRVRKTHQERDQSINMGLTNLSKARLPYANLAAANLYRTNLQHADLQNINLQKATLQAANLKACQLYRATLQAANLQSCNLQEATLYRANLQQANLYNANLQGATLHSANLQDASLQSANLQGATLCSANLQGAFLYGTNLQNANLQGANLQSAFLPEANLQGANLHKANLQNVTGLTDEQLKPAKLCMTILPNGAISDRDCAELGVCSRPHMDKPI